MATNILKNIQDLIDEENRKRGNMPTNILNAINELIQELDGAYVLDEKILKNLEEVKYISGSSERNIRIDNPAYGGQGHAHIYGRKGNELGVVNLDGTASHGTRMRLQNRDADALRGQRFKIREDNIVEWVYQCKLGDDDILMLEEIRKGMLSL